jgi:hypothetical protein
MRDAMKKQRLQLDMPGAAHFELPADVSYLDHEDAVFRAMLRGWRTQQHSRQLSEDTIEGRESYVGRLQGFTNQYPWQWGPGSLEDFTSTEFRSKQRAKSTIRGMHNAIGLFCEYITDVRCFQSTKSDVATYTFSREAVSGACACTKSEFQWKAFDRMTETATTYTLVSKAYAAITIPKRNIPEGRIDEFAELLKSNVAR